MADGLKFIIELVDHGGGSVPSPQSILAGRPANSGINIIPPASPQSILAGRPAPTPGSSPRVDELQEVMPVELAHPLPLPVTIVGGMRGEGGGKGEGDRPPRDSVMELTLRRLQQAFDAITKTVAITSSAFQSLAGNDQIGALTKASLGAAQALSLIPGVGKAAASGLTAVVASIKGILDVAGAFVERGRELSRYSPELAVANARAQLQSILDDIREAQGLGGTYARLTDTYTEFQHQLRRSAEPYKRAAAESANVILEGWNNLLSRFNGSYQEQVAAEREKQRDFEMQYLRLRLNNPTVTDAEKDQLRRRLQDLEAQGPIRQGAPKAEDILGQVLTDLIKQSYLPPPAAGNDPVFGAWRWGTWSPALTGGF